MKPWPYHSVLITGASSGIGEALAKACAARGTTTLFLCGRNRDRLEAVAQSCRANGAVVYTQCLDITDEIATRNWIEAANEQSPLELVFSNAGVATGAETEEHVRHTFAVNIGGALNVVWPAVQCFRKKSPNCDNHVANKSNSIRQIVLTASIAGYAPLSTCPAYSASKAALKTWGLAWRKALAQENIRMNVVCPGFVRSRITDANTCPMPFFMEADRAANIILDRVVRNVGLIAFPAPMRFASWFLGVLPWRLAEWMASLLPAKNAETRDSLTNIS